MGKYYGITWSSEDSSLAHYGILGQKWGVRRFQNLDRSLTPEGKERYGRGDGKRNEKGKTAGWFSRKEVVSPKQIEDDFVETLTRNKDLVDQIHKNRDKLTDAAKDLSGKYAKVYESMSLDAKEKESIWA